MKKNNVGLLLIILLFLILTMGFVSAGNLTTDCDITTSNDSSIQMDEEICQGNNPDDEIYLEDNDVIVVNDWEELQYYCSLNDKNYTLKLKENTNFYPNDPNDSSYQVLVKNNVKIIGSNGSYIGDKSPNAAKIQYTAIIAEDDSKIGISLENITFKWIATEYQSDGVFLTMAGDTQNSIKNCYFCNITTNIGHSSIVYLRRGDATLENCTFINCTTDFGCVSIYDPRDNPYGVCYRARMIMKDCYFENNFASTEPGCINNCGILTVYNTTFYKNTAFWWAGAIHTHGGANTTIYNSNFMDNIAGWNGGALFTYSWLQVYNSTFKGNNCTTNNGGGAIGACYYLHSPFIHIEDCLFENNENTCWEIGGESTTGTGRGGAISIFDDGLLEVFNSTFIKNSASIGSAICALEIDYSGKHNPLDIRIVGNKFINHTRIGEVLIVNLKDTSVCEIRDNVYSNNSIVFSRLNLIASNLTDDEVIFNIDANLANPTYYDEDILNKCVYDVYVNEKYVKTVNSTEFSLKGIQGCNVYVLPSIGNTKSNYLEVIIPKNSSVEINVEDVEYGQNQIIRFNVAPNNATGNLNVLVNNILYVVNLPNPVLNMGILEVGQYNVSVTYNGDKYYYSSFNKTFFVVNKIKVNESVIFQLNNNFSIDLANASGNLTVLVDGKNYTAILVDGFASVNVGELNPGTYDAIVVYSGDDKFESTSKNVVVFIDKIITKIVVDDVTANYGVAKTLVITLNDANGRVLTGKKVTVKVGTISKTLTTNNQGQISLNIASLVPNSYKATIKFAGDAKYASTSKTANVVVNKAASKITAKKKIFKAKTKVKKYTITLKAGKKPINKVKVTLTIKGKTLTAKTNAKGKSTFKIKKLTKKGKHIAVIKFKGNKNYNPTTKTVKITVKK